MQHSIVSSESLNFITREDALILPIVCCMNHTSEAHLVKLPQYPFPPEKIILLVPRASQQGLLRTSALKNFFESNLIFRITARAGTSCGTSRIIILGKRILRQL